MTALGPHGEGLLIDQVPQLRNRHDSIGPCELHHPRRTPAHRRTLHVVFTVFLNRKPPGKGGSQTPRNPSPFSQKRFRDPSPTVISWCWQLNGLFLDCDGLETDTVAWPSRCCPTTSQDGISHRLHRLSTAKKPLPADPPIALLRDYLDHETQRHTHRSTTPRSTTAALITAGDPLPTAPVVLQLAATPAQLVPAAHSQL
jgi:hypothetical protein